MTSRLSLAARTSGKLDRGQDSPVGYAWRARRPYDTLKIKMADLGGDAMIPGLWRISALLDTRWCSWPHVRRRRTGEWICRRLMACLRVIGPDFWDIIVKSDNEPALIRS